MTEANASVLLVEQCKKMETALTEILTGGKPTIDPSNPDSQFLFDQITRMYQDDFIDPHPLQLVTHAGRPADDKLSRSVTSLHPLTDVQMDRNHALSAALYGAYNKNFQILGAEWPYREASVANEDMESADNLILSPGDLYGLSRFAHCLQHNAAADAAGRKCLVIQNENGFYDPTLKALSLDRIDPEELRDQYGIVITETQDQTQTALKLYGKNTKLPRIQPDNPLQFKNGVTVFFASTQPKKHKELAETLRMSGTNASSRNASDVLFYVLSAEETSLTYSGNALEKANCVLDRIYALGYDKVAENIRKLGLDPDDVVFSVNDTGLRLADSYRDQKSFKNSAHETVAGLDWPGVELGPVMNAEGGEVEFFSKLEKASKDRGGFNSECKDDNVFIFFKAEPNRDDVKLYGVKGTEKGNIIFNPRPFEDKAFYSEHFTVPDQSTVLASERGKTKAELGMDYTATRSSLAHCVLKFLKMIKAPPRTLSQDFKLAALLNPYLLDYQKPTLATSRNIFAASPEPVYRAAPNFLVNNRVYNPAKNGGFYDFFMKHQGFVFGPHGDCRNERPGQRLFLFSSAVVAKQIHEESIDGKPLTFIGSEDLHDDTTNWNDPQSRRKLVEQIENVDLAQNPWGKELLLFDYLHGISMIKERPGYLMNIAPTGQQQAAMTAQREYLRGYERRFIPDYQEEVYGNPCEDLPSITVFGSAGTRNPNYTKPAEWIGFEGARRGLHVITGGGSFGIMGAVNRGFLRYRAKDPAGAERNHITAIQMPATLQSEGLSSGNDQVIVAPTMDEREHKLIGMSDVLIALEGGYGTIREISNFMHRKETGNAAVAGKSLIIVNRAVEGHSISFYDPLLAALPAGFEKKYDIHVVADEKQAMDLADSLIKKRQPAFGSEQKLSYT